MTELLIKFENLNLDFTDNKLLIKTAIYKKKLLK